MEKHFKTLSLVFLCIVLKAVIHIHYGHRVYYLWHPCCSSVCGCSENDLSEPILTCCSITTCPGAPSSTHHTMVINYDETMKYWCLSMHVGFYCSIWMNFISIKKVDSFLWSQLVLFVSVWCFFFPLLMKPSSMANAFTF